MRKRCRKTALLSKRALSLLVAFVIAMSMFAAVSIVSADAQSTYYLDTSGNTDWVPATGETLCATFKTSGNAQTGSKIDFEKVKDNLRDKLKHDLNKLYMSYDSSNDKFILNDMLPKLELYNFQVNEQIYKNGISVAKGYEDNGIETTKADYIKIEDSISTKKQSFKDAFL